MVTAADLSTYSSNKAGVYLIPVCTLGAIALILVVARISTKLGRTGRLFLDDWLIVAAEVLSVVNTAIVIAAVRHGWGRLSYTFTPAALKETLRLQFASQVLWIITLCIVRVSFACSLLQFGNAKVWFTPLYFLIGLQVLISSSCIVIQFGQCTPISTNWENVPDVKCWATAPIVSYNWAISAIYIVMDLTLSLMPIRLILTLHRSKTERCLICVLMSLGLLATAVACIKMTTFNDFGKGDVMQATIKLSMLARLEEIVGIIACSLAFLKSPVERVLKRSGILKELNPTMPTFVNAMSLQGVGSPRDDSGYKSGAASIIVGHYHETPESSTHDVTAHGQVGETAQTD